MMWEITDSIWAVIIGFLYSTLLAGILISIVQCLVTIDNDIAEYSTNLKFPKSRLPDVVKLKMEKKDSRPGFKEWWYQLVDSQWQVCIVGIVERFLLLTSIIIGRPEFIAVWLTLKTVYRGWSAGKGEGRGKFNNFVLGNGLSILFAIAGAGIIQGATGTILTGSHVPALLQSSASLIRFSIATPVIISSITVLILCAIFPRLYEKKEIRRQELEHEIDGERYNLHIYKHRNMR